MSRQCKWILDIEALHGSVTQCKFKGDTLFAMSPKIRLHKVSERLPEKLHFLIFLQNFGMNNKQ